jgi:hypothetical protein
MKAPRAKRNKIMGPSHHFLRSFKKAQISVRRESFDIEKSKIKKLHLAMLT